MRKWIRWAMLVFLCLLPVNAARAAEMAEDISAKSLITEHGGFRYADGLFDGDTIHPMTFGDGTFLTLEYEEGIGSLYLIFDVEYGPYTVTDNGTGQSHVCGEAGFLHEFIDLEAVFGAVPTSVTLRFENGSGKFNELYAFTAGQVPSFVQQWSAPAEGETDLILFSTHGDDEQLFFAGLLPYYAGELGYQVQVVYLTNHRNLTTERCHEMLNGLWAVGVTAYPVFGPYGDYLTSTCRKAYNVFHYMGIEKEELLGFVVEQLRRFKPLVAVGHDLNGEYGHGMHMLYADLLCQAVEVAKDPEAYPELAEAYGTWDVPKTYLHLYPENEIVMDWDRPLSSFGGMTAFEVTKYKGFACHITQYSDFEWYLFSSSTAAGVPKYNPCQYGLYRSTVGADVQKNDFFENLTTYGEQKRLAEEAARAEAERLAAEEALREEEAKKAEEAREEEAAAQRAAEELASQEAERREQARRQQEKRQYAVAGILLVLLAAVAGILLRRKRKAKKSEIF